MATSVRVHKALTPENYVLPFKGFIDAVRNSFVKNLSTSTLALITGYDLSKRAARRKLAGIRTAEDAIECGIGDDFNLPFSTVSGLSGTKSSPIPLSFSSVSPMEDLSVPWLRFLQSPMHR